MGGRFGEILLLLILVLLFFGPSKLPDMAKAMGQALNEFKKAVNPDNQTPKSPNQTPTETAQPLLTASTHTRKSPARKRRSKTSK